MLLKKCTILCLLFVCIFFLSVHAEAQEDIPTIPKIAEIHEAAKQGDLEAIKAMLQGRPELVNSLDRQHYFPLHWAVKNGHKKVAQFLIEKGADVNQKTGDHYRFTPLHWASGWDMADFLVSKGADLKARDRYDSSVLIWAAAHNRDDVIELLLTLGAEADEQDMNGWSGLHWAAHTGSKESAEALLENGAKNDIRNNSGETPLHRAVKMNRPQLLTLLLEKGAPINAKDLDGWTPLHLAAIRGQTENIKLLMENKAALRTRDKQNRTPLQLAIDHGHPKLAVELAKKSKYSPAQQEKYSKQARDKAPDLLKKTLLPGQAVVWYLGMRGWAVRTEKHLLVFNYFSNGREPDRPSLANGHMNPKEINHLRVYFFFSTRPLEAFKRGCYRLRQSLKNVHYIGDLPDQDLERYTRVQTGQATRVHQLEITAIRASGNGYGFLVNVDGVSIFHGGEHGVWSGDQARWQEFSAGIGRIKSHAGKVDIVMAATNNNIFKVEAFTRRGIGHLIEQLQPKLFLPMSFTNEEFLYRDFVAGASVKYPKTRIKGAKNRGDYFLYNTR